MKTKTQYACQQCGHTSPKWIGRCPSCQEWNTFVEERIAPALLRMRRLPGILLPFCSMKSARLVKRPGSQRELPNSIGCLGGGVVAGALVSAWGRSRGRKIHADAGNRIASVCSATVLYASGEESAQQIKMRGERLERPASRPAHLRRNVASRKFLPLRNSSPRESS